MTFEEMIIQTRVRAELEDREQAEDALVAVLETLGERLPRTARHHLIAQLPGECEPHVNRFTEHATENRQERYTLEAFFQRVTGRMDDVRYSEAVRRARAAGSVIVDAVTPGELKHIMHELPDEFGELFGALPGGPGSATAVD